ncbi:MAG: hypothetical protein AUK35_05520 [Zetaproteobacteria bacterium CG2_30_46_52]|nr:MAG: hypothetical protein AUK35_05520 [Zetaproteobacteria bacterium CG2_30_46_52]
MWQHIKSQTWVLKTQLMFSAVAMLLCLYAMSVVHQHEQGYHSAQSDCISCDIESLLGHGLMSSVVVSFDIPFAQIPYDAVTSVCQPRAVLAAFQARAPPFS